MQVPALLLPNYVQFIRPKSLFLGCYSKVVFVLPNNKVMSESTNFVGIDVSKDSLDVYSISKGHLKLSNDLNGHKQLVSVFSDVECCFVMEATGIYHLKLAEYIYGQGDAVCVVNPLVIKRYIQMKLQKVKTDKSDAKMIALYASEQGVNLWQPDSEYIKEARLILSSIDLYQRQLTMLKNKLHSLERAGVSKGKVLSSLKRQKRQLKAEVKDLEDELESLIRANEGELYTHLLSIPGIGKKTASLLISSTNGFKSFESAKQLSSYFGMSPTERSSGSSLRGRVRINKTGSSNVRTHLFMCSFTASQCNPQCAALYNRLVNKGRSKKLALIAVCNKLLKQAFAISRSGVIYDPQYKSQLNIIKQKNIEKRLAS